MSKHTALPWESYGGLNIRSVSGEPIAACGPQRGNNPESNAINEANVAFIVKAVNYHQELVEALEACEKEMRGCAELIKSNTWRDAFNKAHDRAFDLIQQLKD